MLARALADRGSAVSKRGIPGIAYVDFLSALLTAFVALLLIALLAVKIESKTPPALRTAGTYAVVVTWNGLRDEDVDTYVQDPSREVVYFGNPVAGLLHLEQDVLGRISNYDDKGRIHYTPHDVERVVMHGIEPGEFAVNVHLYRQGTPGPTPVTVELWKLIGSDRPITTAHVVLAAKGDEKTAFRFTVTPAGGVTAINHLPIELVGRTSS